jgi:hypothetical protein
MVAALALLDLKDRARSIYLFDTYEGCASLSACLRGWRANFGRLRLVGGQRKANR